jgi:CBS domain-containing protein
VRDLVTSRPAPVDAATSVYELGERMVRERRLAFPVVEGETLLGVVTLADASRVPLDDRSRVSVADVTRRVAPLDAEDDAAKALRALAEAGAVPVVENGSPVGLLMQSDVLRALQLQELATTQHPAERLRRSRFFPSRHAERHA